MRTTTRQIKVNDAVKVLLQNGYKEKKRKGTSHRQFENCFNVKITIPGHGHGHGREINPHTWEDIVKRYSLVW